MFSKLRFRGKIILFHYHLMWTFFGYEKEQKSNMLGTSSIATSTYYFEQADFFAQRYVKKFGCIEHLPTATSFVLLVVSGAQCSSSKWDMSEFFGLTREVAAY